MEPQQAVKGTLPVMEMALPHRPDERYGLWDLLLKLEQQGQIVLPRRKSEAFVRGGNISFSEVPHKTTVIAGKLKNLFTLRIEVIESGH
ncbi:MAG TPA: hypothetical protein DCW46_03235 [Desulfotomaculum sp.]|nr:hypothetical protein [Desulfotomaculum sp.]